MNETKSKINSKTIVIHSAPKTPPFNLKIGNVDYGIVKQHNNIKTNTIDSKIDLTFSVLSKITTISIRTVKDEKITIKWNKIKGRFELADNQDIIITQKSQLSKFSKIFFPSLAIFIVLIGVILLLLLLL